MNEQWPRCWLFLCFSKCKCIFVYYRLFLFARAHSRLQWFSCLLCPTASPQKFHTPLPLGSPRITLQRLCFSPKSRYSGENSLIHCCGKHVHLEHVCGVLIHDGCEMFTEAFSIADQNWTKQRCDLLAQQHWTLPCYLLFLVSPETMGLIYQRTDLSYENLHKKFVCTHTFRCIFYKLSFCKLEVKWITLSVCVHLHMRR